MRHPTGRSDPENQKRLFDRIAKSVAPKSISLQEATLRDAGDQCSKIRPVSFNCHNSASAEFDHVHDIALMFRRLVQFSLFDQVAGCQFLWSTPGNSNDLSVLTLNNCSRSCAYSKHYFMLD